MQFKCTIHFFIVADQLELVMISTNTSVLVGDTALLFCVGYGIPELDITWSVNGTIIQNSTIDTISDEEITRGGRLYIQSLLRLCSQTLYDFGMYTCSITNGLDVINATTFLSVTGTRNMIL